MKKLVEKLLSWCKKSMKMSKSVRRSTAPVTGRSVGQAGAQETGEYAGNLAALFDRTV